MKAKDQQKELEKMIDVAADAVDGNVPQPGELPEMHAEPAFEIDYDKIQRKSNKQAKVMLKAATGFMIGDELVKDNPYIQSKLRTDILSLGGMLYQVELLITMQKALSEEIRHGSMAARMFEVFSGLSKAISENNKQLLQTVEAIKVTYMDLKDNIIHMGDTRPMGLENGLKRTEEGTLALGSREMINDVNARKKDRLKKLHEDKNDDIQDIEAEEV